MTWSLYQNNKPLEPLKFSNSKTQEDVVKEVLDAVEQGHKVIFIHGICGTGKSAIALNIAHKLGKTSVVVPGKNLQAQYKKDYESDKYLLKHNKEKLKISVITGRNNHKCKFLEINKNAIPKIKQEINSKLHDIFSGKREEIENTIANDISADNYNIPCKIEIKEKNWRKIQQYIKQNKKVNVKNFSCISDVKRFSFAGVCPYWSPVLPEKYAFNFKDAEKKKYRGLNGNFIFYQRKPGCKFYEQFNSYMDSDVIVFNSLKYKLESAIGRKPLTEVEIIDECDEFLDSFSNQRNLNIERLQNSLIQLAINGEIAKGFVKEMVEIIRQIKRTPRIRKAVESTPNGLLPRYAPSTRTSNEVPSMKGDINIQGKEIIPLKETGIYDLFKIFLNSQDLLHEIDDESYVFDSWEIAKVFEDFLNETYVTFDRKENNLIASIVTTNLAKKFREMVDKNKIIVLMSGTIHSENVLKSVFGLEDFKIIEAETEHQGRIDVQRTGLEMDCKYFNFSSGKFTRKGYLKALNKCVEVGKKPILIHVNAFSDLPSEEEIKEFKINNLISREKLKDIQGEDKTGKLIQKFKDGGNDVLFSTRCARGIDFPGEECNSIVFTKYPNPNVQDAFWKILMRTKPQQYWDFYKDKARRELWQKVYRGLRFKEDHVFVLSPDSRVLESFEN
ncbi:DEAD/DEAH box helicase family protein [Candidatus Pacearchaeota archaeon]|nr:DEAD/DEAH box helicase family protein [Candidatus Pacearchaeota archaeon]